MFSHQSWCISLSRSCHILYFICDFMISQLLITSGSCKAMMCWAPGPLLTSWSQLVFPLQSSQGYGKSQLRQPVSTVGSQQSWSQNRAVSQREVNPQNDTASLACMRPVVSAVLICDYVTSHYWMTWAGLPACSEVIDTSECSVERLQHNLLADGWNCFLLLCLPHLNSEWHFHMKITWHNTKLFCLT